MMIMTISPQPLIPWYHYALYLCSSALENMVRLLWSVVATLDAPCRSSSLLTDTEGSPGYMMLPLP
jgi:hypothetical protein